MLPYFAFIDYPCPAYKNPSDYYRKFYKSIIKLEKEEKSPENCSYSILNNQYFLTL